MKSWQETKNAYLKDHLSKSLQTPNRRVSALNNIEKAIKMKNAEYLHGDEIFKKFDRDVFLDFYTSLKGKHLNSAEESVINGLYKFCK